MGAGGGVQGKEFNVRYTWSNITQADAHWEQAFS